MTQAYVYRYFQERVLLGSSSWTSIGIDRCLLLKGTYTFSPEHQFVSNLTPATHEVSVPGYERVTLGWNLSMTGQFSKTKTLVSDIPSVSFPLMTATGADAPRYAVFYDYSSSDASAEVAWIQDFEAPLDVNASQVVITPPNSAWLRFIINPTSVTP